MYVLLLIRCSVGGTSFGLVKGTRLWDCEGKGSARETFTRVHCALLPGFDFKTDGSFPGFHMQGKDHN